MRILSPKKHFFIFSLVFIASAQMVAQESANTKHRESTRGNFTLDTIGFQRQKATVTIHEDSRIKKLLGIKTDMDRKGQLSDNYRIQLYYGNINEANKILNEAKEKFPKWKVDIVYETPNFKVWLGNYRSKLEVDRAMKEVAKEFPGAFSFSPDI